MRRSGQVALLRFPQTDLSTGKLRPVVLIRPLPGPFDDWLACMVSSQLHQAVDGLDEVVRDSDEDFVLSGLKTSSVLRVSRIAVVDGSVFAGAIGQIDSDRLRRIRLRLGEWIGSDAGEDDPSRP